MTEARCATSRFLMILLTAVPILPAGCKSPAGQADDDFLPFEGAKVDSVQARADRRGASAEPTTTGQFIIKQLERLESQMHTTVSMAKPELLWLDADEGQRQGVAVVLLVRNDVYAKASKRSLNGPPAKLLTDLMESVGGTTINGDKITRSEPIKLDLPRASVAQTAYAILKSAGQTGRMQGANRWVLGYFLENGDPTEAFRPIFDELWEVMDSLRTAQPVLIIGRQVLNEDDLRLRRLYRQAGRSLNWPTHAGGAPDPGLRFGPQAGPKSQ